MLELTPKQKKLYELLQRTDPTLGQKYLGILSVKDDASNPDRFAQAAHSARSLGWLLRDFPLPSEEPQGDRTHKEKMKHFIAAPDSPDELDPSISSRVDLIAGEWCELHNWFNAVSKGKLCKHEEFDKQLERLENVLLNVLSPSYEKIAELDTLLQVDNPTLKEIKQAISLITKQGHYEYFFGHLKSEHWLKPLKDEGIFKAPPAPVKTEGGIRFPSWPASKYLARIANKESSEVLQIIKEVETDNFRIHEDFVDAALKMPASIAKELIPFVAEWIKNPFCVHSLLPEKLSDLTVKLCTEGETDSAFKLAEILLDITTDKPDKTVKEEEITYNRPTAGSHFDDWVYKQIAEKVVPSLAQAFPIKTVQMLADKLEKAGRLENEVRDVKDNTDDLSSFWRPAVEDHEQNWGHEGIKDVLLVALRDLLTNLGANNVEKLSEALSELNKHKYSIFTRIELHVLRIFPKACQSRIKEILSSKEAFDDSRIHHEYFLLLQSQYSSLPFEHQQRILKWIEQGPDLEERKRWFKERTGKEPTQQQIDRYTYSWQLKRLCPIKDFLPTDCRNKYDELVANLGEPEHPEFEVYHYSWSGPTTPLTQEELHEMTPAQILDYLVLWKPPQDDFAPSPAGLGRTLADKIKLRPQEFAQIAPEFLKRKVRPTYIYHLLEGLCQSLGGNKEFNWEPVIRLCEEIMISRDLPESVDTDKLEISWQGVPSAICRLLEGGFKDSKQAIPYPYRKRAWSILEEIIKNEEPTVEYEKEYGGTNMAPATLSINTVRGQAMHAIISYALWCAKHEPAGSTSKMPPEVKILLTNRLNKEIEPTLTVHSVYGYHLLKLFYLDKDWVIDNLKLIFPEKKFDLWNAAWEAYITFCPVHNELYSIIKGEYQRAVEYLGSDRSTRKLLRDPDNGLAEHLMILYWRGKETLDKGSLIYQFFKKAPPTVRGHAIKFLGQNLIHSKNEKDMDQVHERLKNLWESQILEAKSKAADKKFRDELKKFSWWFINNPFDPSWTIRRFEETVELTDGAVEMSAEVVKKLTEYLDSLPVETLKCLSKIVKAETGGWDFPSWREECLTILTKAKQMDEPQVNDLADKIIDFLVLKGYHEFRECLQDPPQAG